MARLLDEYPDVFDAYWLRITRDIGKGEQPAREKFASRREATRAARIRKAARR